MSAPYDPTNPANNALISGYPTNERGQRLGTETSFLHEHVIRANDTGQHVLGHGADAVRDGAPYDPWTANAAGLSLFSKSDTAAMGSDLLYLDPGTGGGAPVWKSYFRDVLFPRQNDWVGGQTARHLLATGAPASCVMDFNLSNFFFFDATADFTIPNPTLPTRPAANKAGCFFLEIKQSTAGNHDVLSWGANFRFSAGLIPLNLTDHDGTPKFDIVQMFIRKDGNIHAEILRDSS